MEPRLLPRKFKIEHDANEYHYFVVWLIGGDKPWSIQIPGGKGGDRYMTVTYGFDFYGHDTAQFETPSAALDFWKKYIEATNKSRVESSRTTQVG